MTAAEERSLGLDGRRRAVVDRLLREQGLGDGAPTVIPQAKRPGPFPLSFAQARLWFLDRLSPGNPFYNVQTSVRQRGAVDAAALERAVNRVVERHEVLRTVFRVVGDEPCQVVLPAVRIDMGRVDLRHLPRAEREREAVRIALDEQRRAYDLAVGPLVRVKLLRLDEHDHVFLLGIHHVVADGWSMGVFARELGAVYRGLVGGGGGVDGGLGGLVVQYADFAVWQRERLSGEWLVGELGWWRERLAGLEELGLPTDRGRPAVQGHRGAGFGFVVGGDVVERLGGVARESGATLFMVGLAGWAVVLGRWCGQGEVVVGAPIAGRDRAELEGLIGFFVNTLVLRVDVSGDPSFVELVGRVREVALGAYAHSEVPFEKLVEELAPTRDLSRNPLFQVTFQLFDSPSSPDVSVVGGGLEIPVTSSLFDVRVDVWPAGAGPSAGWSGRVEFDTDLFERSSIEALIDRFVWLLDRVGREPQRPIGSWSLLPPRHRVLLEGWNATGAVVPGGTVVAAFEARVGLHPDVVAVSGPGGGGVGWLTYRELNGWANRLAHRLVGAGVGRGDLVAVCVPRGCGFVVAALAVMKAGAAYVPLDPVYPPARLAHVIGHARPRVVITTGELAGRVGVASPTIIIDGGVGGEGDADVVVGDERVGVGVEVGEHDLAYVIYTSGSTGVPKGVEIEHHSLMNLIGWHNSAYSIVPQDRASQIASVGFDAAVWEIWPYLAAGASVHTATDDIRADPDLLIDWLDDQQITIAFIPTPLAETLLDKPWPATSTLHHLLTGGDTLHRQPNPEHPYTLVNHYGPTETTVVATATSPTRSRASRPFGEPPSIGSPIANTTCVIIDPAGRVAGPGQSGELHIGGPGLARGYHDDAELTSRRFIVDPTITAITPTTATAPAAASRFYATGDLARWNPDGTITFLGRTDNQLKIRGHRIEPAELESIITTHPNITNAIVTTHPHPATAAPQLAAYITINHDDTGDDTADHEQVEAWRSLYQDVYRPDTAEFDPDFDIRGWHASDTGQALGADAMSEQVDHTVARITALGPCSILEIGCGSGLLLHRLAASCERYWATDFSAAAIERLQAAVNDKQWRHVELFEREALDLDGIDATFDVVVINSVVQYFPSARYLELVLDALIDKTSPGGSIFVGDVRNHALIDVFHTTVELAKLNNPADTPTGELRARIARSITNEQELLIDPAWFTQFIHGRRRNGVVDIHPRRGHHINELTRFRYDATLHFDRHDTDVYDQHWLDWTADTLTPDTLHHHLATLTQPIGVRGVPSSRLTTCVNATTAIHHADDTTPVDTLIASLPNPDTVDPETLWAHTPNHVEISWHENGRSGRYDIIARPADHPPLRFPPPQPTTTPLTNQPVTRTHQLIANIRDWIHTQLPDTMIPTWIIPIDHIPLTTHGKIDHTALPPPTTTTDSPADGGDNAEEASGASESLLVSVWSAVLGLEHIGRHDNFFALGGDSILAIKLATRAGEAGLHFSTGDVFKHQTVAELARVATSTPRVTAEQGAVVGEVPLTPIQHWFFDQQLAEPDHFNQAVNLPIGRSVDLRLLVRALRSVVAHHDALHLSFARRDDASWDQVNGPPGGELSVVSADLSRSAGDLADVVDRACTRIQRSVSLAHGLVRVGLLELGAPRPRRLVIAVHHTAVDGVSWRILLEDLWTAYDQLTAGSPVSLPPKSTSFRSWARRLERLAADSTVPDETEFWLAQLEGPPAELPRDLPGGDNSAGACSSVRVCLTAAETDELLHRLLVERRVEINDALVAAAARAVAVWSGRWEVGLAIEGHGREPLFDDVDLTRTVGWFTTIYPVRLRLVAEDDVLSDLAGVAEQLRRIPRRGIGFGLLRHLSPRRDVRDRLASASWPSISFNYLGQLGDTGPADQLREHVGAIRSPAGQRAHLLELNGVISDGRLQFDIYYSTDIHRRDTVEALGAAFVGGLRTMLSQSRDVPVRAGISARVSARDADAVLGRLERPGSGSQ